VRRNRRTLIAAIAVGALVLAGSAAFTDTLTTSDVATNQNGNYAGYGTVNVTNGSLEDISYTMDDSTNPPVVSSVELQMLGDTHLQSAYIGFNESSHVSFGPTDTVECTQPDVAGAGDGYDSTTGNTEYNCDLSAMTPSDPTPAQIQDTDVALANT